MLRRANSTHCNRLVPKSNCTLSRCLEIHAKYSIIDPYILYISTGEAGTWASSNEKVLTVDRLSGHGLALAPGTVSVSYNMSSQITTVQVGCNIFNSLFHLSYELFIANLCYNIEITKMRIFFRS